MDGKRGKIEIYKFKGGSFMNTRKLEMERLALSKIGPSFEELNDYEMMEFDGQGTEWLVPISNAVSASSPYCAASLAVSIITYCAFH